MWLFFNISLSILCFTVFPKHITKICYICLKYAYCTWRSLVWPAEISIYLQKIQHTLCRFLLLYSPFYIWSRLDHYSFKIYQQHHLSGPGGGGTPIWNRRACSSVILNLTPKGDNLGVAQAFCEPWRRPIWAWLKQILTPKNKLKRKFQFLFCWILCLFAEPETRP